MRAVANFIFGIKSYKCWLQRTAGMLVLLLTVHSVFLWGETIPTISAAAPVNVSESKTSFYLPEKLGRVREVFRGEGSARLVLIEDAHVNEPAQRQIGNILNFLAKKYALNCMLKALPENWNTVCCRRIPIERRAVCLRTGF